MMRCNEKDAQAKVLIGFQCNNHCLFCFEKKHRNVPDKDFDELKQELRVVWEKGYRRVHFIGGEPTIYPSLLELIRYAKKLGFAEVMITTNGRMLAYKQYVSQLIDSGINQIVVSIHGPNAHVHDKLTGVSGSFKQTLQGIRNLKESGTKGVGVNIVITKQNYKHLPEIAKLAKSLGIDRVEFLFVSVIDDYTLHTPAISKVYPYLIKAFKYASSSWTVNNLPMGCYTMGDVFNASYAGDKEETKFIETAADHKIQKVEQKKVITWTKVAACGKCRKNEFCRGIQKIYIKHYGINDLKPYI